MVTDVREADVGSILGWGFAPFTGGTLSYIDMMGTKAFVALCRKLEKKHGRAFAPNKLLDRHGGEGRAASTRALPRRSRKRRRRLYASRSLPSLSRLILRQPREARRSRKARLLRDYWITPLARVMTAHDTACAQRTPVRFKALKTRHARPTKPLPLPLARDPRQRVGARAGLAVHGFVLRADPCAAAALSGQRVGRLHARRRHHRGHRGSDRRRHQGVLRRAQRLSGRAQMADRRRLRPRRAE